jgi:integrase
VESENQLSIAIDYFRPGRHLTSIRASDIQDFTNYLRERPNGRSGVLSGGTVRHYLNTLSNLYRRAASEGYVPPGYNPVSALIEKPQARRQEAQWLEVPDAALLLESARTFKGKGFGDTVPIFAIMATFLLTGGRKAEVLGLELDDVSFDRRTVTFRPNRYRRLKTNTSHRSVPLWPQLEEVLQHHMFDRKAPLGNLLFPSPSASAEGMIKNLRKSLDAIAVRAGWKPGDIRTKIFRHTYCAARLQTLDHGAPVSEYTVAREMGHGGSALVRRVYGHLGQVRHRSEVVEYRVDQHTDTLHERLVALRAVD